jgi:hypothetical protein
MSLFGLAQIFLYESHSPVSNLYFKEGDLHLKERLIRVLYAHYRMKQK